MIDPLHPSSPFVEEIQGTVDKFYTFVRILLFSGKMLKGRLPLPILFSFLSPFLFFQSLVAQQPDAEDLFSKGFDMMMERKYQKALPLYEQLVEKRPESPHAHYFLGSCLHRTPDRRLEGIPHLEKAVEHAVPSNKYRPQLKRDNVPMNVHYLLADLYHLDYQFAKAIKHYKTFKEKETEKQVEQMPVPVDRKIAMCERGLKLKHDPREVEIRNLGSTINSKYKEHSPVVTLDERTLYFTSKRLRKDSSNADKIDPATGTYYEDIYTSFKKKGEWQEPEMLALNTEDHEATINLSKDAQKLFVYKADEGNGDIFVSKRSKGGLGELKKMGDHVNSDAKETHLDISADRKVMYYTSNREGGQGGRDIYMVKKLPTGEWAKPQNLGPTINTQYDEDGPFIHPDGKTLYFSSKGHGTMGGYDIFKTQQNEDGSWQKPQNIGYPINSPDHDIYFVTSPDGKRAYYSSDFKGLKTKQTGKIEGEGESDIYLLKFPQAKEKNLAVLEGVIKPGNCQELLAGITIMVEKKQNRELINQLKVRTRDGGYVSILPPGETYTITYMHEGEVFHNDEIKVEEDSSYKEIHRAINLDTLNFDCSRGKIALVQDGKKGKGKDEASAGDEGGEEASAGSKTADDEDKGEKTSLEPYKRYFGYNENKMAAREKEFTSFLKGLVKKIEASEEVVELRVEASASRVPTSSYSSNQDLAKVRAENAMKKLREELAAKGVKENAYSFAKVEQLVQGPKYQGDHREGKDKYGEYQYVKLSLLR